MSMNALHAPQLIFVFEICDAEIFFAKLQILFNAQTIRSRIQGR